MKTPQANGQPLVDDLKLRILRSSTVVPSDATECRSFFLSNIDQVLNFDVDTLHFFSSNPDFPPDSAAIALERALSRLLVPYDFLAGRLRFNSQQDRLEIYCNAAGAYFSVASSELELHQLGDLIFPNPTFRQLLPAKCEKLELEDRPLLYIQVTAFKCGGFALALSNNHTSLDGISAKAFFDNLAALAHGDRPLSTPPFHNRLLLSARSPPRVTFPHPELLPLPPCPSILQSSPTTTTNSTTLSKIFHLSPSHISQLKSQASSPAATSFNVVAAHIWRCKALATASVPDDANSKVLFAVDIRPRLKPPLPRAYAGNAVLTGYGQATRQELAEGPLVRLVEAVREGAERMTDEYARSVIDWGQLNRGFPRGDVLISSWWRLGFEEVDYPWGKPIYSCPIMIPNSDIILLLPNKESEDRTHDQEGLGQGKSSGVNVCVSLPDEDMQRFESLFYKYLA